MLLVKKRKIYDYAGNKEIIPIKLGFVNSYLIKCEKNLILVDTGTPGSEKKLIKKIKSLGFNPAQISLIIITHVHVDHCGSIKELKRISGAKIAVHKFEAGLLRDGVSADIIPVTAIGRILGYLTQRAGRYFEGVNPDIIVENELSLSSFGCKGKVISTPGHTNGSVSILLNSGSCITGDILVNFLKLDYSPFATDIRDMKNSLKKVLDEPVKNIYISHGSVYSDVVLRQRFFPVKG